MVLLWTVSILGLLSITTVNGLVIDNKVVCAVATQWSGGNILLEDLKSGSYKLLDSTGYTFNSLTRDELTGIFYAGGKTGDGSSSSFGGTSAVFSYNPCDPGVNKPTLKLEGVINDISLLWSIAFNPKNRLLYALGLNDNYQDGLWSIDPITFDIKFIGITGTSQHALQGAEFDNKGVLYVFDSYDGLSTVNIKTATATVVGTPLTSFLGVLSLAFDPENNNFIYGNVRSQDKIYLFDKRDGTFVSTNLKEDDFRGLYILDQNKCGSITDCNNKIEYVCLPCKYTKWYDRDNPTGTGDWETISSFKKDGINICGGDTPLAIKCRDKKSKVDFNEYPWGNYIKLVCDPKIGFICKDNDDDNYDKCPDFQVSFCCPK